MDVPGKHLLALVLHACISGALPPPERTLADEIGAFVLRERAVAGRITAALVPAGAVSLGPVNGTNVRTQVYARSHTSHACSRFVVIFLEGSSPSAMSGYLDSSVAANSGRADKSTTYIALREEPARKISTKRREQLHILHPSAMPTLGSDSASSKLHFT